jgi:hypothetical protein
MESLKSFIQSFDQEMANIGSPLPAYEPVFTRVIILQFNSVEDTAKASDLLTEHKAKMMSGNFQSIIL